MMGLLKRFWTEEEGASLAEYAVLVALIVVVAIAGISAFGNKIRDMFTNLATSINP